MKWKEERPPIGLSWEPFVESHTHTYAGVSFFFLNFSDLVQVSFTADSWQFHKPQKNNIGEGERYMYLRKRARISYIRAPLARDQISSYPHGNSTNTCFYTAPTIPHIDIPAFFYGLFAPYFFFRQTYVIFRVLTKTFFSQKILKI